MIKFECTKISFYFDFFKLEKSDFKMNKQIINIED